MTVIKTGQSLLGSINNAKSTYTSNNLSTKVNLNQEGAVLLYSKVEN